MANLIQGYGKFIQGYGKFIKDMELMHALCPHWTLALIHIYKSLWPLGFGPGLALAPGLVPAPITSSNDITMQVT